MFAIRLYVLFSFRSPSCAPDAAWIDVGRSEHLIPNENCGGFRNVGKMCGRGAIKVFGLEMSGAVLGLGASEALLLGNWEGRNGGCGWELVTPCARSAVVEIMCLGKADSSNSDGGTTPHRVP